MRFRIFDVDLGEIKPEFFIQVYLLVLSIKTNAARDNANVRQ